TELMIRMKRFPILLLLSMALSYAFPVLPDKENGEENTQLVQYLKSFYELKTDQTSLAWKRSTNPLAEKIKIMQDFFGLKVTGKADSETVEVIKQPRCGVPDVGLYGMTLPGWKKPKLTYRIVNYTPDMERTDVEKAIQKAFQVWSSVSQLTFSRIYEGIADIMIAFGRGVHGRCPRYFDGHLGVLGHAFPPGNGISGDVHFDEDEDWTFGHALGLSHSNDARALMFPNYKFIDPTQFPLSPDDISGIQSIYGPSPNSPNKPDKPQLPKTCDPKLSFDAITTLRREIMFLKGRHLWRVYPNYSEAELELISTFWPSLPSGIEAAYENTNDQVLFFKDNKFWVISGYEVLPGYPKNIDVLGFPRSIKKIDAAICNRNTGKTDFFVGQKYWRYDETSQSMDKDYPKQTADDFPGIGQKVDAVFQHNGFLYFFHGSMQWEFDPNAKRVIRVLNSNSWFNC
uniref:Matrix metallopeptidase 27 n=1 Tax=Sphenodon punctatus TaxID=8508 RepID=A0A8D0GH08_SPHPU